MNLFSRISDLLTFESDTFFDCEEDQEIVLADILGEMEEGLQAAKRYAATVLAAKRRIAQELEKNQREMNYWRSQASRALAARQENLARRALVRKSEHEKAVRQLAMEYSTAQEMSEKVKSYVWALESYLAEVRRQERSILDWQRMALARKELDRVVRPPVADGTVPRIRGEQFESALHALKEEWKTQAWDHDLLSNGIGG